MPSQNRATIKDIASSIGLSTATVSQALRPREGSNIKLKQHTIDRVREAAVRLNYRPHAGARSIRAKVFQNVGFFTAKEGEYTHSPDGYFAGVHEAAEKKGYRITHIRLPRSVDDIRLRLPALFDERNLDALIIGSYHPITSVLQQRLQGDNLPIVFLNDKHPHNSVFVDEVHGSRNLTEHLIALGHKRIAFFLRKPFDEPPLSEMHYSTQDRLEGYTQAMNKAGLSPSVETIFAHDTVGQNHDFPDDWRRWINEYDALFAYDDDLANQLGRFFYKNHIRVPEDISLAGYNGDYGALSAWQDLTTMRIPAYEMGQAAFEIALDLVENENSEPIPSRKFIPTLLEGGSAISSKSL